MTPRRTGLLAHYRKLRAVTVSSEDDLERTKAVGRVCALARDTMAAALASGHHDGGARRDRRGDPDAEHGARSAPALTYGFPGATCISVNEEVAHGIPGSRGPQRGTWSTSTCRPSSTASSRTPARPIWSTPPIRVWPACAGTASAPAWEGIRAVRAGQRSARLGDAVGAFARKRRLLAADQPRRAMASAAACMTSRGRSRPGPDRLRAPPHGRRPRLHRRALPVARRARSRSTGSRSDGFTLLARPSAPTVQFEHTVVATPRGALVVTL